MLNEATRHGVARLLYRTLCNTRCAPAYTSHTWLYATQHTAHERVAVAQPAIRAARSIMVFAAPSSACRMEREASTALRGRRKLENWNRSNCLKLLSMYRLVKKEAERG
jgi:hypothetical protein